MEKDSDPLGTKSCSNCRGTGRLEDIMPKSTFAALDWLSYDGEPCNNCQATGKVPKSAEAFQAGCSWGLEGKDLPPEASGSFQLGYKMGKRELDRVSAQAWAQR